MSINDQSLMNQAHQFIQILHRQSPISSEFSIFDMEQQIKLAISRIQHNDSLQLIIPDTYQELIARIEANHHYLLSFYQACSKIYKRQINQAQQYIELFHQILGEFGSFKNKIIKLQQCNDLLQEHVQQLLRQTRFSKNQNLQLFDIYESSQRDNQYLQKQIYELESQLKKLNPQVTIDQHDINKYIQQKVKEETKKMRVYYETTLDQYQTRVDQTSQQRDYFADKYESAKRERERYKSKNQQLEKQLQQLINELEKRIPEMKVSHDSCDYPPEPFQMDSLNSSINHGNQQNHRLTEEFGHHQFQYRPIIRSYSIRTINPPDENQTFKKQLLSTARDELSEKTYPTYFDPQTQKQLLKDPYLSHFLLTAQAVKIKQDREELLDINMKPYYETLIYESIPMHLWADWIRQKLITISQ